MRILALLLAPAVAFAAPVETSEVFTVGKEQELHYLQYLPEQYDEGTHPLVIFLHGAGERGDSLEMVKKHGPPKTAMDGHGFPFILIAPQCPAERWWNPDEIIALTRELTKKLRVDPTRVHLTGLSMGGFGTWACLAKAPELYACGVPICGGGDPSSAGTLKNIPIWAFHGDQDDVVPATKTREMEKAILAAGGTRLRTSYYPDAKHDSWSQAYSTPALFAWMMLQQRPVKTTKRMKILPASP
ncbi:prolyl oligopeptidase family serine peptidase [Luteolibacter marinus]|uniref:carboxylesterase family protein n=1 Tax=Luteolibacter marinus TaxID=2776705 RepID=UPI001865D377|nr:prolyl oligopeptidase family serine peptidase [Luteolibacter marinus]